MNQIATVMETIRARLNQFFADLTELNHLMRLVGVKYLPSVYYKVRMLPFDSAAIQEAVPTVRVIRNPTT